MLILMLIYRLSEIEVTGSRSDKQLFTKLQSLTSPGVSSLETFTFQRENSYLSQGATHLLTTLKFSTVNIIFNYIPMLATRGMLSPRSSLSQSLASNICSSLSTSGSFNSKAKFHNASPTVFPFTYLTSPFHSASPLPIRSQISKEVSTIQENCHTASPSYMLNHARCQCPSYSCFIWPLISECLS